MRSNAEIEKLWQRARRASDDTYDERANAVYDTLQWLLGNDDADPLGGE